MPEPITTVTIIALHSLATKLVESIKDGKDAAKAQEILRLVGTLQSEYFALQQHIVKIESENAKLIGQATFPKPLNPKRHDDDTTVVPDLDDLSMKILKVVADATNGILKERLLAQFGLSGGRGEFILEQLSGHKLIEIGSFNMGGGGMTYYATSKCRAYLNERGLL